MKKKNKKFNTHHLFQQCDGGNNHPDNLLRMDKGRHLALHVLFGEDCTLPIDKIEMIVEMHRPVLCDEFVTQIMEVLDFWRNQKKKAYNPSVMTRRTKFK